MRHLYLQPNQTQSTYWKKNSMNLLINFHAIHRDGTKSALNHLTVHSPNPIDKTIFFFFFKSNFNGVYSKLSQNHENKYRIKKSHIRVLIILGRGEKQRN
ncbi:hypothetical protein ABFS83_14G227800 [Erythranthe nasuta]